MRVVFITAARNAGSNYDALCASIDSQNDDRWIHQLIDDSSDIDKGYQRVKAASWMNHDRCLRFNSERRYALRNIVECARGYQNDDDVIIATVDGDDQLCNDNTVKLLIDAYDGTDVDVAWTAHTWDVKPDMNISRAMPQHVDPYEWPWCSSHLRSFRASLLRQISDENFVDHKGEWFKRGYDQILMLPLLKVGRRRQYIDEVCYTYRIDSCSIPLTDRPGTEVEQLNSIAYVRARGFVK